MSPIILYLSYDGLTDPLGQSQILPYLCGLSKHGYKIFIISAEKKDNFAKRKELLEKIVKDNNLIWEPVFYTKKPPVLSTLRDIYTIRRKALELHAIYNFSIVHCRSYITALVGLFLKRKKGIAFIFDMRGFWADERVEGGLWKLSNPVFKRIYTYFKAKEKEFLKEADYTICLTYGAKEEIHKWPDFEQIPIEVIPCCVDTDVFIPAKNTLDMVLNEQAVEKPFAGSSSLLFTYKSSLTPASFVISYLGSLGTWYMIDEMLHFFKRLLLKKPTAQFLFITPDNPQFILTKAIAMNIPVEKVFITKAERQEVPQWLGVSDFSVFFIKPCFSKKASSPTKMGEILSMGIPVICNSGVGDTNYLFSKYTPGILVDNLEEKSYDRAIARIDQAAQIPPQYLRNIALEYFALEKGVSLYHRIYQNLIN